MTSGWSGGSAERKTRLSWRCSLAVWCIDGEAFLLLEDKDLEKLGVTLPGERLKLRKLIRDAIASNDERPIWIYVDDSNIIMDQCEGSWQHVGRRWRQRQRGSLTSCWHRETDHCCGQRLSCCSRLFVCIWATSSRHCLGENQGMWLESATTYAYRKRKENWYTTITDITERACMTPEEQRTMIVIISGDADVVQFEWYSSTKDGKLKCTCGKVLCLVTWRNYLKRNPV